MIRILLPLLAVLVALWLANRGGHTTTTSPPLPSHAASINVSAVCLEIASSVSEASGVFFNGHGLYPRDIGHFASSSTQEAACSFQPGTAEDVGIALQILGRTRCPFAVKGGGHSLNPGFSSTLGVQIAMRRLSNVTYDSTTQTAKIGAGMIWDDVYAALEPYGMNVAGGRVSGIGVAGFTLGGGYSWHANQYGLTIDTVDAFELVLPNGAVTNVTASQPDLFFALKGGFNNFGIVTQFTFRAFPQTQVWGGVITYDTPDQLTKATAKFAENNADPRANVITSYGFAQVGNVSMPVNIAVLFYDAPLPPAGLFDDFLTNDSDAVVFTRPFLSLVTCSNANATWGLRASFHTISVLTYSEDLLQTMLNESILQGTTLPLNYGYASLSVEPLLPDIYNHTASSTAWPPSRALPFSPLSLLFGWSGDGTTDDVIIRGMQESVARLRENVQQTKQLPLYGNYAPHDTPLEAIYGANVERLTKIKREVDPENVMGLAGGFKL